VIVKLAVSTNNAKQLRQQFSIGKQADNPSAINGDCRFDAFFLTTQSGKTFGSRQRPSTQIFLFCV